MSDGQQPEDSDTPAEIRRAAAIARTQKTTPEAPPDVDSVLREIELATSKHQPSAGSVEIANVDSAMAEFTGNRPHYESSRAAAWAHDLDSKAREAEKRKILLDANRRSQDGNPQR